MIVLQSFVLYRFAHCLLSLQYSNIGVNGNKHLNKKKSRFETFIDASKKSNWILGFDAQLALGGEKEVVFVSTTSIGNGSAQVPFTTDEMGI